MRIRRGAFATAPEWREAARAEEFHRARIDAAGLTRRKSVAFAGESAATLWGLPRLGPPPRTVELADTDGTLPRSKAGVVWRRGRFDDDDIVEVGGVRATSLERTLIDIARSRTFESAVMALDAGTRMRDPAATGAMRDALLVLLEGSSNRRGIRRARYAIEFSDARADRAGESLSRCAIHRLGFPAPRLQVEFPRDDGGADIGDFDWEKWLAWGEFDGFGKYVREEFTHGRPIDELVYREKLREDRIRRRHRRFVARWGWQDALNPLRLARILADVGLPQGSPRAIPGEP